MGREQRWRDWRWESALDWQVIGVMTRRKEEVSKSRLLVGQAVARSVGVDMSGCSCR